MNYILKSNKNLLTYTLIILLFLIPLFFLLLVFLGLNYYSSKINKCSNCGTISLGFSETCINCGSNLSEISKKNQINEKPSESTIEVMAEEIK